MRVVKGCDQRCDGILTRCVSQVAVMVAWNNNKWGNVGKVFEKVCGEVKILW